MSLKDYSLGEMVYEGPETQVRRAVHSPSGARVVLKMHLGEGPNPRVLGRLLHEYQVLTQLAAVAGVARVRELLQQDSSVALVLQDPGFRSLDRILAARGRLPVDAPLAEARRW